MSLPPATVLIKRKRTEDPIDSLYFQIGNRPNKRPFTDVVFRRVIENDGDGSTKSEPQQRASEVETTSVDLSSLENGSVDSLRGCTANALVSVDVEERPLGHDGRSLSGNVVISGKVSTSLDGVPGADDSRHLESLHKIKHPLEPYSTRIRHFHLRRPKGSLLPVLSGGIRKSRHVRGPNVTLLAEEIKSRNASPDTTESSGRDTSTGQNVDIMKNPSGAARHLSTKQSSEIKDNGSAVLGRAGEDPVAKGEDRRVECSASELEELPAVCRELMAEVLSGDEATKSEAKIWARPCALPKRCQDDTVDDASNESHSSEDATGEEHPCETEYVYDTFVYEPQLPAEDAELKDGHIAILVIDEEVKDFWLEGENFEAGRSYEDGYDDDEEDENAEDYYANDYPEDPDSDDDEDGDSDDDSEDDGGDSSDDEYACSHREGGRRRRDYGDVDDLILSGGEEEDDGEDDDRVCDDGGRRRWLANGPTITRPAWLTRHS